MNLFFENGICLTRTPVTTSAYKLQHLLLTMSRQCFDCAWSPKNMTSLVPEAGHNSIRFWQKSRVFFQVLIRISLTNIFGMSCSKYWVRAPSWAFYCILTHPRILLARDWSVSNTWCMTTSEKTKHMRIADVSPQVVIPLLHCSLTPWLSLTQLFLYWISPLLNYSFLNCSFTSRFLYWTVPLLQISVYRKFLRKTSFDQPPSINLVSQS